MPTEDDYERGSPQQLSHKGHGPPTDQRDVARVDELRKHPTVGPVVVARDAEDMRPEGNGSR